MPSEVLLAILPSAPPFDPNYESWENNGLRPYLNYPGTFTFSDASFTKLQIADEDSRFNYLTYANPNLTRSDQALLEDTVIGDYTVKKGTQISDFTGTYIQDSQGNQFVIMLAAAMDMKEWGVMPLFPERRFLVFAPVARTLPDGEIFIPRLNPFETFTAIGPHLAYMENSSAYFTGDPYCFTRGTLIATLEGPRLVEELMVGDLVLTRDNGAQPIRWIGETRVGRHRLDLQPNLRPICIAAGALGHGLPASDLTVSPQHRVLVKSTIARRFFGAEEVLVPAKHLLELPGVEVLQPESVDYIHLLFDRHEIVNSNGAWTESLFVGPQALRGMSGAARREIFALFPELCGTYQPLASRLLLDDSKGRALASRHLKSRRELVAAG